MSGFVRSEVAHAWRRLVLSWIGIAGLVVWEAWPRETLRVERLIVRGDNGVARAEFAAVVGDMSAGAALYLFDRDGKTVVTLSTSMEGGDVLVLEAAEYTSVDSLTLELRDATGAWRVQAGSEYRPDGPAWLEVRGARLGASARLSAGGEAPRLSIHAENLIQALEIAQP